MTLYEAQAAAPILASVFGDAEVRQEGRSGTKYFVRVYHRQESKTIDIDSAYSAGYLVASHEKAGRGA